MGRLSVTGVPRSPCARPGRYGLTRSLISEHEPLDNVERDRNEEDSNHACGQHSPEDSDAQKNSPVRPGPPSAATFSWSDMPR